MGEEGRGKRASELLFWVGSVARGAVHDPRMHFRHTNKSERTLIKDKESLVFRTFRVSGID